MTTKIITLTPPSLNPVAGSGPGGIALILKDLDEIRQSTTTLIADSNLFLPLTPNERWIGSLILYYQSNAAIDISGGFTIPSGGTGRWGALGLATTATSFIGDVASFSTTNFTIGVNLGGADATDSFAHFTFVVQNGGTAGNLSFVWSQRVSTATDTTVFANSFITAHRL